MVDSLLNQRVVRAPEFGRGLWLNVDHPLTLASLRGRVVLVDIWEYSCINCLRTLPYLREWHRRYADLGLTIIGVHAPEFPFGRERQQLEMAVRELDIPYPVLMDNDFQTWDAYANRFWPAKYLIDSKGYLRFQSYGEGGYAEFERAIAASPCHAGHPPRRRNRRGLLSSYAGTPRGVRSRRVGQS
jgi:thiol-disulfide isomerase/thioredoxin